MNKLGPIVVIEDDQDDQLMLSMVFNELAYDNEIRFFSDGERALAFLSDENVYPFIVLSDINLPKLDGFRLRAIIKGNEALNRKCIPYLFFSTSVERKAVLEAYEMAVQGFFLKPSSYETLKDTIRVMVEYWKDCYSPSNYKVASIQPM